MYYKFLLDLNVFRTFAAKMRNVAYKICAVMLAVWYLMSNIGFGVHTCRASQRSFVTTFVSAMTCEDIHPEHHCTCAHHSADDGHDCCGHGSPGQSVDASSCCTDDFKVLSLTGVLPSYDYDDTDGLFHAGYCQYTAMCKDLFHHLPSDSELHRIKPLPDSGYILPDDVQSVLGIWRI